MSETPPISALVLRAFGQLAYREQRLLALRFAIGDEREHSQDEIARYFNITVQRVDQIERQALRKLDATLDPSNQTNRRQNTMTTETTYTIEHTQDEHGEDHWHIADEKGDWIEDSYPTRELAAEVIASGNMPTARYCVACSHYHEPGDPCRCPECGEPAVTPGGACGPHS